MPSNNLAHTVFQRMNRHQSMAVLFRKPAEQQAVVLARYPSPEGLVVNQDAQVVEDRASTVAQNPEIARGDQALRPVTTEQTVVPQVRQPGVPQISTLWQPEQMQPYSNLQPPKPGETSRSLQRQISAKPTMATVGVRPESSPAGSQVAATAQNNEQSVVPKVQRETTQRTETESNVASSASAITDSEKTPLWMQSISRAMHLHDAKQNSEETVPENTPALATRSATSPRMESDVNSDAQEKQMAEPSASTRRATIIEAPLNASARQQKSEEHLSTATAPQQSSVQRVTAQPSQISPATQSVLQQATSDKSTGTKASAATANVQPNKAYTSEVSVAQPSVSLANATDAAQFVKDATQNQTSLGEPPSPYPAEAANYLPSPSQNDESQSQVSDETDNRMPLESAWPVQRTSLPVQNAVGNRSDTGEVDFSGTTSKAQERIHKVTIQSEMPTDSLIDLVTPRRPPPRRSQIVQPQQVEEVNSGQSPDLHTPENATIQRKAQDGIAAATVSTQPHVSNPGTTSKGSVDAFAGFPEDLWHLIGETAPTRQPIQTSPVESPAEPFSQSSGQPVSSTLQMQTNSSNQQHEKPSHQLLPDELAADRVSVPKEVRTQPLPDNDPLHSTEKTTNRAANEANEGLTNRASVPQVMRALDSAKATDTKSVASETRQQAQTTTYSAAASNVVPVSDEVHEGIAQEQTLQVVDTQKQAPLRSSAITQADSVPTSKSPIESTDSMVSMKPLPQPALPQPASSASPEIRPETSKNSSPIEDEKGVKPKSTTARESVDEVIQRMEQQHSQQHSTQKSRDLKPQPTGGQTIQSIQPATPAIQRANEPVGGQEQSQNGGATDEKKTEKAKLSDADKDELVRQVYTKLKRKLAVERERVR